MKSEHQTIYVGMVGTGWAGAMHARGYHFIHGMKCRLKTVCSLEPDLPNFAVRYGFEGYEARFETLLADREIDVIDIVTPPSLHVRMIEQAIAAGKHVICEKPITGCFGVGSTDRNTMLEVVQKDLELLRRSLQTSKTQFFYAENWIYSPPFLRMAELIAEKKTRLAVITGQTGHKGSHAEHAQWWKYNGGGALIRQGTHPVSAALWLKQWEAAARGVSFGIESVYCDSSCITKGWDAAAKGALHVLSQDVEDWSRLVITFTDGTKADLTAGDVFLSQIYNKMEVFGNDAVYRCNMTPNDLLETYFANDRGVETAAVMEKNDQNMGWQKALVSEEMIRGYAGELQDFLECVLTGQTPRSGFDLASMTLLVIYAGYLSAQEHRTVTLDHWCI